MTPTETAPAYRTVEKYVIVRGIPGQLSILRYLGGDYLFRVPEGTSDEAITLSASAYEAGLRDGINEGRRSLQRDLQKLIVGMLL